MVNRIVTIGALYCFEDLISRVNFVKLTLKSINEELNLHKLHETKHPTKGEKKEQRRKTQQRGRTQFQAKRMKHKMGHKGTK